MRQFLAVPLPENFKEEMGMITSYLQEVKGLKPVKHKNMHITLLFLGDKGSHSSNLKPDGPEYEVVESFYADSADEY